MRERGDEKATARGLSGLGAALLNLGERAAARELLEESLVLARRYGDRWGTAMSLTMAGHVDLADGDHARAPALLADAASLFANTGNLMYLQWCLEGLAGAAAARGDYDAPRNSTGHATPRVPRQACCWRTSTRPDTRGHWPPSAPHSPQQLSTPPAPASQTNHHSR
jgi:hypothetical protein